MDLPNLTNKYRNCLQSRHDGKFGYTQCRTKYLFVCRNICSLRNSHSSCLLDSRQHVVYFLFLPHTLLNKRSMNSKVQNCKFYNSARLTISLIRYVRGTCCICFICHQSADYGFVFTGRKSF